MADALPAGLGEGQERLLRRLQAWAEGREDVRWLVVGCSLARGNSDDLSDADVAVGVDAGGVDRVLEALRDEAGRWEPVVGAFPSRLPEVAVEHGRLFVQFASRVQLDAVVIVRTAASFPGMVVLYDPDGTVVCDPASARPAQESDVLGWVASAWEALSNVDKYVRRGSLWEAHAQVEVARSHYWRVLAYEAGLVDPQFGLTTIYDEPDPDRLIPSTAVATIATAERSSLLTGARQIGALLVAAMQRDEFPAAPDHHRFAGYVVGLLDGL